MVPSEVYDVVCGLLSDNRFSDCDDLLSRVDTDKTDESTLLSFLMATVQIPRDRLPHRQNIYDAALSKRTGRIGIDKAKNFLERFA